MRGATSSRCRTPARTLSLRTTADRRAAGAVWPVQDWPVMGSAPTETLPVRRDSAAPGVEGTGRRRLRDRGPRLVREALGHYLSPALRLPTPYRRMGRCSDAQV